VSPIVLVLALGALGFLLYEVVKVSNSGTSSGSPFIDALAAAIAKAEGADPSINNPGDLTAGDVDPSNITGTFNNAGVVIIDSVENGWNFLYGKLQNIFSGNSEVYNPSMTISEFAQTYTGGDNADSWASTVASALGVTPDTTLADAQSQYGGN
jgi:hypothetical protein